MVRVTQLIVGAILAVLSGAGAPSPVARPGIAVEEAYVALHAAGLRVTIDSRIDIPVGLVPEPMVVAQRPRAGAHLPRGSIVTLTIGRGVGGVGSPGVSDPLLRFTVPDFRGRRVSLAYAWTEAAGLYWTAHLGRLRAGRAATLYGNYRVVAQSPAPGSSLTDGVGGRSGPYGYFRPTPLIVWGVQAG